MWHLTEYTVLPFHTFNFQGVILSAKWKSNFWLEECCILWEVPCDGRSSENKPGCFPPTLQCWRMKKPWRVSLPTCRVGCWKANLALIAAVLFFAGFPQLPEGGREVEAGKKSNTMQQLHFLSSSHNSRQFKIWIILFLHFLSILSFNFYQFRVFFTLLMDESVAYLKFEDKKV